MLHIVIHPFSLFINYCLIAFLSEEYIVSLNNTAAIFID